MTFPDTRHQVADHRLITAEIRYHMPDQPERLQSFIFQKHDIAPDYPALNKFLDYWRRHIEGRLHSVRVASVPIVEGRRAVDKAPTFVLH